MDELNWFKSSFSAQNGGCVEVARTGNDVLLRDTKNRSKGAHKFTQVEWDAFIAGAKAGEFDIFAK